MDTKPAGLAPEWVVGLIESNPVALNARNTADLKATFSDDAVLTDMQTGRRAFGAVHVPVRRCKITHQWVMTDEPGGYGI